MELSKARSMLDVCEIRTRWGEGTGKPRNTMGADSRLHCMVLLIPELE